MFKDMANVTRLDHLLEVFQNTLCALEISCAPLPGQGGLDNLLVCDQARL